MFLLFSRDFEAQSAILVSGDTHCAGRAARVRSTCQPRRYRMQRTLSRTAAANVTAAQCKNGGTMKAVRLYEYGGPENLKFEVDVPEPTLGADSVLIEAAAASVNPIDWKIRSGARQKDFPLTMPAILGRDVSGVVRAVGSNIRTFKPGARVLAFAAATYAEFVVVEGSMLTHLPDGLNLVDAAAIPLVVLTGEQLVRLAARVQSGQTILGSGALGGVRPPPRPKREK